jgi:hypothetical protein
MKALFLISIIFFIPLAALCQNEASGVYISADDFRNNRISFSSICNQDIKTSVRFKDHTLILKQGHHKQEFNKARVFAVKTCENTFRIQNNSEYRVVNLELIPLYSQSIPVGGEGAFYDEVFFFSVERDSEIIPLSKRALKAAYPENLKFDSLINFSFKNDRDLGSYNEHLKTYMVIHFFKESLR